MPDSIRARRLEPQQYISGILSGNRVILARAITLIESESPADTELSAQVLDAILPHAGAAHRVGITGIPGAGKSTFIEVVGLQLIREYGENVAVLTVDPSSPFSGGSILGDKTRMARLAVEPHAFIRPSPARGHLGGIARRTREAILLCEAAGFKNVLVETVGVGQSESAVRSMTDFFLLLAVPGAGDELQGIKRGVMEMVDGIAINKADGDNERKAELARVEYSNALRLFPASADGWIPRVVAISSLTGKGIPQLWRLILDHRAQLESNGALAARRRRQALDWMQELVRTGLEDLFRGNPVISVLQRSLEEAVEQGTTTPLTAARELLSTFTQCTLKLR